ncbi:MobA/MobL family protein [Dorea formicigenerans]|uniref:MobA/MobL family protein n=1 Tax=Dorea formicigenerans TaxID=39486 RepID=UPI002ED2D2F5
MVIASAAYISGQRIFDSYYNKIHDYTSKSGVVFTEILTPEYVPERLTDRETLWNSSLNGKKGIYQRKWRLCGIILHGVLPLQGIRPDLYGQAVYPHSRLSA